MQHILQKIIGIIEKGEGSSPFLFLSQNLELLHQEVYQLSQSLLKEYTIDTNSLFHFSDSGDALKIEEIRNILQLSYDKPRFKFQIFLIENISRLTLQSSNALLKFLEEPGQGNIIFLTNTSDSDILETILSRVQIIRFTGSNTTRIPSHILDMVQGYYTKNNMDLISYLFTEKLEPGDYKHILRALFMELSNVSLDANLLDELEKDMQGLEKNNLSGKYVVDKYLV